MATTTTTTNKPLNPRAQDLSPKGYNRANIFSGKALDFDGVNDYVGLTTNILDFGASNFTHVAIVRGDWSSINDGKLIYVERASSMAVWQIRTDPSGSMLFQTNVGGSWLSIEWAGMGTQILGKLTHLAFVRVGTAVTLYMNGRNMGNGSGSIHATLASGTGNISIGHRIGTGDWWNGLICGVKTFNTALTAAQVSDLYLNPEKIVPDGVASSALKLWLPMMEGAGASAYDGSGNGNDGTINGATWTAGIGAPVAQTALVSWNKGTNLLTYSEELNNAAYIAGGDSGYSVVRTANYATAPNGTQTADRLQITRGSSYAELYQRVTGVAGTSYKLTFWGKALSGTPTLYTAWNGAYANEVTFTSEWVEYSYTFTASSSIPSNVGFNLVTFTGLPSTSATADILIWGVAFRPASAGDAYIKTNATAQTSAVLVPEGLTAGASIFGTDIITPRNAFALNLDGASWAQVGDNASLDFGSGEFSVEAWGFRTLDNTWQSIMQKGTAGAGSTRGISLFYSNATNGFRVIITANSEITIVGTALAASTWNHVVVTRDASLVKMYVNGTFYAQIAAPAGSVDESGVSYNLSVGTDASNQRLNGQLANPRIYNRALTAAEVLRNYNADKAKFGL